MFDESQHLVARTLDPTNSGVVWDKFYIYQGHRVNTPYIQIGTKRKNPPRLKLEKHANAIRRALHYKELLDSGQVDSQGELSRLSFTPRRLNRPILLDRPPNLALCTSYTSRMILLLKWMMISNTNLQILQSFIIKF